jgi:hypothetical protein
MVLAPFPVAGSFFVAKAEGAMIAPTIVKEVRRLLTEERLSQRKVARLVGISRGTVGRIASGERPDYPASRPSSDWPEPSGPPQRCSCCGGMVYMPCRLCYVRTRQLTRPRTMAIVDTGSDNGLSLELSPEQQARYELLHERVAMEPSDDFSAGDSQ